MSWSVYAQGVGASSTDAELVPDPVGHEDAATMEQVASARAAVRQIIESGAVGDSAGPFTVNAHGHANAGHVPTAGWSNDFLGVNVTQGTPPNRG